MRQIDTPWMDGVPYITQCPIPYGTKFRYIFHALDEGTHFYHSHSGHQKIDGVFGALIVREPIKKVPNRKFYDFDLAEHVIMTSDWMHSMAENHTPGMARRSALSESMLINGRGRFFNVSEVRNFWICDESRFQESDNKLSFAPWTIFHVRRGFRYRFRIVNSAFNVCPFQLQVESHNFSIIATELSDIKPILDVDTLHFLSGERFDIVINAKQPAGDYWIRTRELMPCWKKIDGFAILRIHDDDTDEKYSAVEFSDRPIPKFDDEYPTAKVFNAIRPNSDSHIKITETEAYKSDQSLLNDEPDEKFYLVYDSPAVRNDIMFARRNLKNFVCEFIKKYLQNILYQVLSTVVTSDFAHPVSFVATVNNITFQFPSFPLLTESQRIDESMFCDVPNIKRQSCIKKVDETICKCIHRLKVKLNASVEIVATNLADKIPHPLHLHGHKFHVVATGTFNDSMAEKTLTYEEAKNLNFSRESVKNPPFKDTALLPFPGFVRFRFRASNPGFWLFHCHYDYHMLIGELNDKENNEIMTIFFQEWRWLCKSARSTRWRKRRKTSQHVTTSFRQVSIKYYLIDVFVPNH